MSAAPGCWTFLPDDPPRSSRFAVFDPEGAVGLFGASLGDGEGSGDGPGELEVVLEVDGRLRRRTVAARLLTVEEALPLLLAPAASSAELGRSARAWAAALRAGLAVIARGALVPAVSAGGWDAWQVDPLEPEDVELLEAAARALPPEARAVARAGRALRVPAAPWLVRALWDALADTLVRTPGAEAAAGTHLFAGAAPAAADTLRPWVTAAYGHLTAPFRLQLRVQPDGVEGFVVQPVIRSTEDPSLVVPLGGLLSIGAGPAAVLGGRAQLQDRVRLALRRGASVWPPLDRLIEEGLSGLGLDIDEMAELADAADALEAVGVDLRWPAELTTAMCTRLMATLEPPAAAATSEDTAAESPDRDGSLLGIDNLLTYRWEVLCGDVRLTESEVAALAEAKRSLVWVRDRWVRVDPAVLDRIRTLPPRLDGPSGLAAALAGELTLPDGTVVEVRAAGGLGSLKERLVDLAGDREAPEPPGLHATLRPYQRRGLAWMTDLCRAGLGGVLADDMGLGKTVQVIALHLNLQQHLPPAPTLVVCPTSLLGNWRREFERFAPGVRVHRLHGTEDPLDDVGAGDVVLVTYGIMRRRAERLAGVHWGLVVADEAQHIKNPRARTSRALRTIASRSRIALTGTPVENRLLDLWSLLDWTTPGLLGPMDRFRNLIAAPIERDGDGRATRHLTTLVRPFLLRRRKTDPGIAPELPPRTLVDVPIPLTAEQLSLYEALVRESLLRIGGTTGFERQGLVFKLLSGLKQITNHPAQFLHESDGPIAGRSAKLEAAVDLIRTTTDVGEQVLVFSQYVEMCRLLERRLDEAGLHAEVLHGGLTAAQRDELVTRFQAGAIPVLVISLKAGGTGLNLTAATEVIHYDRWWNPAVEDQATDRAWRIGQDRPVVVHRLICEGTVEERIAALMEEKRRLADRVVGAGAGGEAWIAELSDAELADLVSLDGRLPGLGGLGLRFLPGAAGPAGEGDAA